MTQWNSCYMWQRRSNDRILWEDPKNIENIICISINQHIATNYMVDFATNPICIIHHNHTTLLFSMLHFTNFNSLTSLDPYWCSGVCLISVDFAPAR